MATKKTAKAGMETPAAPTRRFKVSWSLREINGHTVDTIAMGVTCVWTTSATRAKERVMQAAKFTDVHGVSPERVRVAGFKVNNCKEYE